MQILGMPVLQAGVLHQGSNAVAACCVLCSVNYTTSAEFVNPALMSAYLACYASLRRAAALL